MKSSRNKLYLAENSAYPIIWVNWSSPKELKAQKRRKNGELQKARSQLTYSLSCVKKF